MRVCLTGLIQLYQFFLSPLLGANCRHLPSCSHYAKDALNMHGPLRGSYFALKRILRCHPWAEPMVDPVPSPLKKPTPAVKAKG
ncbi:MAG: membrane protein insertion efficiency factor YidD [Proteobacteria bacterium]|nr:membrane protein insertion efficiency factor YidD [Pseudomonadota bacterium]